MVAWAGYDHLQQARALSGFYVAMKEERGWTADRLLPLIAGVHERVPWLLQWHNDFDPEMQLKWGDYFREFVTDELQANGFTFEAMREWRPTAPTRKKKK